MSSRALKRSEEYVSATGLAALLLALSVLLGVAALVRRSRALGIAAGAAALLFLAYAMVLLLAIRNM